MGKDDLTARIQRRAYELWEAEGRPRGREMAHWLRAETEIKGQAPAPYKPTPPVPVPPREKPKRPPQAPPPRHHRR